MSTSKASSFAKPLTGRMPFIISLPPVTSQELSPLSESTSFPPVPFENAAANSGGQPGYAGVAGAGGNAGTTDQTTNTSDSN